MKLTAVDELTVPFSHLLKFPPSIATPVLSLEVSIGNAKFKRNKQPKKRRETAELSIRFPGKVGRSHTSRRGLISIKVHIYLRPDVFYGYRGMTSVRTNKLCDHLSLCTKSDYVWIVMRLS